MAVSWLTRLAARAPVPVYVVAGEGADALLERLTQIAGIEKVLSPRHASMLLIAGAIPEAMKPGLETLHDQLPHPRVTVWCPPQGSEEKPPLATEPALLINREIKTIAACIKDVHLRLLQGARDSEADLKPDEPLALWQGQGDHGQGGEGMMGGKPYGRPMAMVMDDRRDGLKLDGYSFSVGPFFSAFPPGLSLHLMLQGDLIQQCEVKSKPFPAVLPRIFPAALRGSVPVAELESVQAQKLLHRLRLMLEIDGAPTVAQRASAIAGKLQQTDTDYRACAESFDTVRRLLKRNGFFTWLSGVGLVEGERAARFGGFVARAAGMEDDARSEQPAYRQLGFATICHSDGDVRARRRQLVAEIEQSLRLAVAAAAVKTTVDSADRVETPWGQLSAQHRPGDHSALLQTLLPGCEWSEALAVITSLPLDAPTVNEAITA